MELQQGWQVGPSDSTHERQGRLLKQFLLPGEASAPHFRLSLRFRRFTLSDLVVKKQSKMHGEAEERRKDSDGS